MAWFPVFRCCIVGKPEPAGSKRGVGGRPGQGPPRVIDANKNAAGWKQRVALEVSQKYRGQVWAKTPMMLRLVFYRTRPAKDYRTGKNAHLLRDDAPEFPLAKPDVLKLARAIEDALTGVIWHDDAQIVNEPIAKRWAARPGVKIEILRWVKND